MFNQDTDTCSLVAMRALAEQSRHTGKTKWEKTKPVSEGPVELWIALGMDLAASAFPCEMMSLLLELE